MIHLKDLLKAANEEGYAGNNATAKVCQDIILKAIADSSISNHATIKGGVVMRELSSSSRRATQDMDIDFIRYSIEDGSIDLFIESINTINGITIVRTGEIEELKQQDYHGKRAYIRISDETGYHLDSKLDLGVHCNFLIEQEEFCFDIAAFGETVSLLVNSKEQMLVEKLASLLKFGPNSTRYKDVFDICYLLDFVDKEKLKDIIRIVIFSNDNMREKSFEAIAVRVKSVFHNKNYRSRIKTSKKNWLDISVEKVEEKMGTFFDNL